MRVYVLKYYDILTESKTDNNYFMPYYYYIIIEAAAYTLFIQVLHTYNMTSIIYILYIVGGWVWVGVVECIYIYYKVLL